MFYRRNQSVNRYSRPLRMETLEARRMLAAVTVTNNTDLVNGDTSQGIVFLEQNTGGDGISLREAIEAANADLSVADEIFFDLPTGQEPITLTQGELDITDAVIIDAEGQAVTIDANDADDIDNGNGTGIFDVNSGPALGQEFVFRGLNLTGADSGGSGGAINFSDSFRSGQDGSTLRIENVFFNDNHAQFGGGAVTATGGIIEISDSSRFEDNVTTDGSGGAVDLRSQVISVTIEDSSFINNSANSDFSGGGGLSIDFDMARDFSQTATIQRSLFTGNQALGTFSDYGGGGIFADLRGDTRSSNDNTPSLIIEKTTVSENHAEENGGGIWVCTKYGATFELRNSTVSGNTSGREVADYMGGTTIEGGQGGGVWVGLLPFQNDAVFDAEFENVTISGNTGLAQGGGAWIGIADAVDLADPELNAELNFATITDNKSPDGGGLYSDPDTPDLRVTTTLHNTIVSGNVVSDTDSTANNIAGSINGASSFNLIGPGVSNTTSSNDPELHPLADNGGLTLTHRPEEASPVVDAGDPNFTSPPDDDQRGAGFPREQDIVGVGTTTGDRVDIGAVELQPMPKVASVVMIASSTVDADNGVYDFTGTNSENGFPRVGSGEQLRTIPIGNIVEIQITFTRDVDIPNDAITLIGLNDPDNTPLTSSIPSYSDTTFTATWATNFTYDIDNYLIYLKDTITADDAGGLALDGEWTNPKRLKQDDDNRLVPYQHDDISEFPSGDGIAGGEFQFVFTYAIGDFDVDSDVDIIDFGLFAEFFGTDTLLGFLGGDYEPDGDSDIIDFGRFADAFDFSGDYTLNDLAFASDWDGNGIVDQIDINGIMADNNDADPNNDIDVNMDGVINADDVAEANKLKGIVDLLFA